LVDTFNLINNNYYYAFARGRGDVISPRSHV